MPSFSLSPRKDTFSKLRPINPLRDLPKIADLVELCFRQNMDREGQRYIRQMRNANQSRNFLQWANSSLPLLGYIWEEEQEIVGNISIVPFRGHYLLANIAVHPDYRRRGIAHELTQHAMQHVRKRGAKSIWLHVQEENAPAIHLYETLGFEARALRTTWNATENLDHEPNDSDLRITTKVARFWHQQERWLDRAYPPNLRWYRMPNFQTFAPGLQYWLYRLFVETDIRQWAVQKGDDLQAVLTWLPSHTKRTQLWLATPPQTDARSLAGLLLHARHQLRTRKPELYLDYPAGEHHEAFTQAGFTPQRTLLWMEAPGQE